MEFEVGPVRAGKVFGLHRVVKELNQAIEGGDPAADRIPEDAERVSQELMLFENAGTDDLEKLVDSTFTTARFTIRIGREDAHFTVPYANAAIEFAKAEIGAMATVRPAGHRDHIPRRHRGAAGDARLAP